MTDDRPTYLAQGQSVEIRPETLLPFSNPLYQAPMFVEIRAALTFGSLTSSEAGMLLGVSGRTIVKWSNGERTIPYAAWRLLLIALRLVDGRGLDTVRVSQLG